MLSFLCAQHFKRQRRYDGDDTWEKHFFLYVVYIFYVYGDMTFFSKKKEEMRKEYFLWLIGAAGAGK
jgi:hypothetical protein